MSFNNTIKKYQYEMTLFLIAGIIGYYLIPKLETVINNDKSNLPDIGRESFVIGAQKGVGRESFVIGAQKGVGRESFVIGAQEAGAQEAGAQEAIDADDIYNNMCSTDQLAVYYQCINNCDKCSGVASQEQHVAWCVDPAEGGSGDCVKTFRDNENRAGTCSDVTKTTRSQCLEGTCSDATDEYITKVECEERSATWTPTSNAQDNTWTPEPNFEVQPCPDGCVKLSSKYMHEVAMSVVKDCKLGYKEKEGVAVPILAKQYMCTPSGDECSKPEYTSQGQTVCQDNEGTWIPRVEDVVPCTSVDGAEICPRGSGTRSRDNKDIDITLLNSLQVGGEGLCQGAECDDAILPMGHIWSHQSTHQEIVNMRNDVQSIIERRPERWNNGPPHP